MSRPAREAPEESPQLIFRAGRQLTKLRFVTAVAFVAGGLLFWMGWGIAWTYGLRPADGGILAPLGTRLLFGGGVAILGLLIIGGLVVFAQSCYVARIEESRGSARVLVTFAGVLTSPTLDLAVADIPPSVFHDGEYWTDRQTVVAPWYTVRPRSRRLPVVIDAKGEFPDRKAFARLFGEGRGG